METNKKVKLSMNLFVLLLLYITSVKSIFATSELDSFLARTSVTIYNQMKDGSNFTVHCKSKDDDLGSHVVQVGSPYEWKFRVNFFATTLFFCDAYWKDKSIGFNGYEAKRDLSRCPWECVWKGSEDGLFGYMEGYTDPDLHYAWK
ncbi:hypothetical protein K2173_013089 [Erythroxylum novogranatense]|uniref:S-protein homolog n=1 Tax=Erythroxylum novogranatense TaxID=1862640 RepID=A0AAV8S546_9ROSI|nr:hypothetical protein K2173_013089 [Erythroxylum novogranatense]